MHRKVRIGSILASAYSLILSLIMFARALSLDYRERVAGNAEPNSGMALTISSRF